VCLNLEIFAAKDFRSVSFVVLLEVPTRSRVEGRQYQRIICTDWRRLLPPPSELQQLLASSHRILYATLW